MKKQMLLEEEDPYSHLGENLCSSILSLLPVHEAVRTSILSRTWRNAWMQIPHLNICFITMCEQLKWDCNNNSEKWIHVVGKILTSHNGHIQSCIIDTCDSNTNHTCIDGWISTLIEKSISELTLKVDHSLSKHKRDQSYRVPHWLFSCKSLHSLELSGCSLRAQTHLSFSCNKLREMKINWNRIDAEFIHALLHQCSSLEILELTRCYLDGCDKEEFILSVNAPHLEVLNIRGSYYMSKNIAWKLVLINAPHLKSLDLEMLTFKESHIIARELEVFNSFMKYEPPMMEAVLNSIAHVIVLRLSLPSNECLLAGSLQIPIFMNLRKVMIGLDFTEDRGVIFFVSMLRRCPYLADLTLWGKGDYGTENRLLGLDYWEKQDRFNCFNHTLQRVTIGWKTKYEIEFAKYVLAKAKVLKHLTVISIMISSERLEEVLAPLLLVKRASGRARVTFGIHNGGPWSFT